MKPKLAVWKFASCDGCQLSLLDLEEDLLPLAELVTIAFFPEASSNYLPGPYDVSLVEGSITTEDDRKRIHQVRSESKFVVTIGACATSGGIQALKNFRNVDELISAVYPNPDYIETLSTSTPIADHIEVDYELHGCPVNKDQLLEVLLAYVAGRKPQIARSNVCSECKAKNNTCLVVAQNKPCLGPVTQSGCGALCPSYARGCYGCFGPQMGAKPEILSENLLARGVDREEMAQLYRSFNTLAPEFLAEYDRLMKNQ